jgi:hypothetical protein
MNNVHFYTGHYLHCNTFLLCNSIPFGCYKFCVLFQCVMWQAAKLRLCE